MRRSWHKPALRNRFVTDVVCGETFPFILHYRRKTQHFPPHPSALTGCHLPLKGKALGVTESKGTENRPFSYYAMKTPAAPVVQTSPAVGKSLPLMREVDSPQAKTEGENAIYLFSLPQSFASQNPAPSSEGAFGRVRNHIVMIFCRI